MLVSHESPISLLEKSRQYNDYDYALVHLFETHPKYYNFFKDSLKMGREVLLDNSIFELGEAFEPSKYFDYIAELQPSYYVVPDVLENTYKTKEQFESWMQVYGNDSKIKHIPKIGVVQGTDLTSIVDCYNFMSFNADYIAISFDYKYYQYSGYGKTPLERMCSGRVKLIKDLVDMNVWNFEKPHHLLGCSLPKEFGSYNFVPNIRSIDTSNPVVAGLHNIRYIKGVGLVDKLSIKLCDLIDFKVTKEHTNNVLHNVELFKNLLP